MHAIFLILPQSPIYQGAPSSHSFFDRCNHAGESEKSSRREWTRQEHLATSRPHAMAKGFLDIPPEVRVLIYDYALYHHETDGIISPLPDCWEGHDLPWKSDIEDYDLATEYPLHVDTEHKVKTDKYEHSDTEVYIPDTPEGVFRPEPADKLIVLIAGQRYRLSGTSVKDGPHFENLDQGIPSDADNTPEIRAQLADWYEENKELTKQWHASAAVKNGHDCSLGCLVQPPLTRVCRLIRKESLPCFYGVNRFHLELHNWSTPRGDSLPARGPLDWWRAIGDTNLRSFKHMSMVFEVPGLDKYGVAYSIGVTVSPPGKRTDRAVTVQISDLGQVPDGSVFTLRKEQKEGAAGIVANKMDVLAPHANYLQYHGLHVQGMECMVSDIEPRGVDYGFRDYSALTPWSRRGGVMAKYDAITASIVGMKSSLWKRARALKVGRVVEDLLCVLLESAEYSWHEIKYFPEETKLQLDRVRKEFKLAWTLLGVDAARDHGLKEEQHAELLRIRSLPTDAQYEALVGLLDAVEDEAEA